MACLNLCSASSLPISKPAAHRPKPALSSSISSGSGQGFTAQASYCQSLYLHQGWRAASVCARAGPFDWLGNLGKGDTSVSKREPGDGEEEEEELATMRRMDGSTEPFGVQAVLLAGFMSQQEVAGFQAMMNEIGATMFRVIPATKAMLQGTLKQALEVTEVPAYEQPPLGTRRTVVLSGMYDGEVIEVVSAYQESGQPPAVFAAAVPNNMNRQLLDLMAEVHREDAAMRQQAAAQAFGPGTGDE